jgi:tripartite-type tricarboxylate transporter receptor subunit TctC
LFENLAGVKFTPVHYRGATPALNDLRAGTINLMSVSVSLALPPYRAGEIKMLGIGSAKRLPRVPDIPTVAETGLPGYQAVTWFGLFGPSAMPPDLVAKLNAEVQKVFSDPELQKRFMAPQMFEAMPGSPQEFAAFIKGEQAKWAKVIREAHITLE